MRCVLLLTAVALFAQPAPKASGRVTGMVINSVTKDPVRRATVILRAGLQGVNHTAQIDGDGRFFIDDVEPGTYDVSADRQGFTSDRPNGVRVEDGQFVKDVIVRLIPQGVITGKMLDDDGDPMPGSVAAMQYSYVGGKRQLVQRSRVSTNHEGDFRLYGLRPGTYYLEALPVNRGPSVRLVGETVRGARPQDITATFFPGTADAGRAVPIEVAAGAQVRGMDITVQRSALYVVRGTFPPNAKGHPIVGSMWIRPAKPDPTEAVSGAVTRFSGDAFEFESIPPGSYVISATRSENGAKLAFAHQLVNVENRDVDVGALTFTAALEISGVVRVDGALARPLQSLRVTLEPESPAGFGVPGAGLNPDGTFALHVVPDIYTFALTSIQGAYRKSIRLGDEELPGARIDLTRGSAPLVIVLATDVGRIEGSVKTANGEPAPRVQVSAVPAGRHADRADLYNWTITNDKGDFRLSDIAPIEYKLFAWEDVDQGAPRDPEFRKPFEKRGVEVKLEPHGRVTVELQAIK